MGEKAMGLLFFLGAMVLAVAGIYSYFSKEQNDYSSVLAHVRDHDSDIQSINAKITEIGKLIGEQNQTITQIKEKPEPKLTIDKPIPVSIVGKVSFDRVEKPPKLKPKPRLAK